MEESCYICHKVGGHEPFCSRAPQKGEESQTNGYTPTSTRAEWEAWLEKMPCLRFYNAAMYDEHMKFWFLSMPCVPKG